ncbi:MAG: hypothetical protein KTR17_12555 [Cellvibrionaceae bacterium]|nr:hypothetical protein [Cellvibrionaceae bacterium]
MSIDCANKVLFVSDGALWIWERVTTLITTLGIDADKVYEVIDFYHAVQYLTSLAKQQSAWSTATQKKWVRKSRRRLKSGHVGLVIADTIAVCKSAGKSSLKRSVNILSRIKTE